MDDTAIADALVRARDNLRQAQQAEPQIIGEEGERFSADENNGENIRRNEENSVPLQEENHPLYKGWEKRNTEINTSDYGATDDFRRLQEESRRRRNASIRTSWQAEFIDDNIRRRLASILQGELASAGSAAGYSDGFFGGDGSTLPQFTIRKNVSVKLFHDIFEIVRDYLPNGEFVDIHDNYDDCICYLSDDGLCGFAINKETGYGTALFNIDPQKPIVKVAKDYYLEQGATHGDCYNAERRPLAKMYARVLGAKIVATMDYNMDYDHDGIAEKYGKPQIVFLYYPQEGEDIEIEQRHFGKDEYEKAVDYLQKFIREQPAQENEGETRFSTQEQERQEAPQNEDLFARAERIAQQYEQQREQQREEAMRFRVKYDQDSARDAYEQAVRSGLFQSVEALQDSQRSVFVAMKSILGQKRLHIEDVPDFMNAYTGENRLSSVNQAEMEIAARQHEKIEIVRE